MPKLAKMSFDDCRAEAAGDTSKTLAAITHTRITYPFGFRSGEPKKYVSYKHVEKGCLCDDGNLPIWAGHHRLAQTHKQP